MNLLTAMLEISGKPHCLPIDYIDCIDCLPWSLSVTFLSGLGVVPYMKLPLEHQC